MKYFGSESEMVIMSVLNLLAMLDSLRVPCGAVIIIPYLFMSDPDPCFVKNHSLALYEMSETE